MSFYWSTCKQSPVPISKLADYVKALYVGKHDCNGFENEFNYIESQSENRPYQNYSSAQKPMNRGKNRYANVLPLEDSRVKLPPLDGVSASDYVNANYINGLIPSSDHSYISTQGPLETTISDFWRLVWSQNASVILMLTKLVENERTKCHRYYPQAKAEQPLDAPGFIVKLIKKDKSEGCHIVTRTLEVINQKAEETRIVTHLQYIEWPDHGLPSSTKTFRELMLLAEEKNTTKGPFVVHCSAGIGRTGTLCTVHSVIKKLLHDLDLLEKKVQATTSSSTQTPSPNSNSASTLSSSSNSSSTTSTAVSATSEPGNTQASQLQNNSEKAHFDSNACNHTTKAESNNTSESNHVTKQGTEKTKENSTEAKDSKDTAEVSKSNSMKEDKDKDKDKEKEKEKNKENSSTDSSSDSSSDDSDSNSSDSEDSELVSHSLDLAPLDGEPCIDILTAVLHMRKQRVGMVQTKEQYEFCYLIVLEFLEDEGLLARYIKLKEQLEKSQPKT